MEKDLWNQLRLYALTDLHWVNDENTMADLVKKAVENGTTMIQLREKRLTGKELEEEARSVLEVCQALHVPLIINDDTELALKIGADGVHVGQTDGNCREIRQKAGKDFIIGVTAPSVKLARQAEADGADYVGAGAMYPTATKDNTRPLSPQTLKEITESISIPVVAIGGLDRNNADILLETGIAGIASSSGVFGSRDFEREIPAFRKKAEEIFASSRKNHS